MQNLFDDLQELVEDFSRVSMTFHQKAVQEGIDTHAGYSSEGKSHAYANAAVALERLVKVHTRMNDSLNR